MSKKKKATRKKKTAAKKQATRRRKPPRRKKAIKRSRQTPILRTRRSALVSLDAAPVSRRGVGARAAGQSGDAQGLSNAPEADSESVEELVEEGQNFEAGVVAGVEDADAHQGEVRTKQVREDDVPLEYTDED
jgi:hypothetical protein